MDRVELDWGICPVLRHGLAALAMVMVLAPWAAGAVELVPGDYPYLRAGLGAAPDVRDPGLVFAFTPRSAVRLTLESDRHLRRTTGRLAPVTAPAPATVAVGESPAATGLVVGGAIESGDFAFGAIYARPQVGGTTGDLLAANFRIGGFTARMGVVHPADAATGDILLFSSELAATSWLALESDVLLGLGAQTESALAAGRIGIRMDF